MSQGDRTTKGNRWAECVRCGTKIVLTDYVLDCEGIVPNDLFVGAVLPLQLGCNKCGGVIAEYRVTQLKESDA